MKKVSAAVIIGVSLLGGCGKEVEKVGAILSDESMTLVFSPGYEVAIDGQPAQVFGNDACPKQDRAMNILFGQSPDEGSSTCLVVTPKAKTVRARLMIDRRLTDEVWTVEHLEHKPYGVALRRPDGNPVIGYDAFLRANPNIKDMRNQVLTLNAKGCVASGPDRKPLQLPAGPAGEQLVIPKGSTFTPECFRSKG